MAEIEIEIDGQPLTAQPNQTIIQVADAAGIYIPRFCYHKHLSIPANCRMCLVEVEKSPKALPACATPILPGMKVFTKSQKTILAQRAVMEFLLINHPLDCPICDQGGECELQDLSMGYGSSRSQYNECKRAVADEDLGPLIATEMTRCIQCTRCVRFGDEIAGLRELGIFDRGEDENIATYVKHAMKSEVSGNMIDLCPVGALTSKPYRFTARAWELNQFPSVAPHDCIGSNLHVHTRNGRVMRVVARENSKINETWLSDRDRFSYTGLYHPDRLEEPMAYFDGKWQAIDWQSAFELASVKLRETIAEFGIDKLGALASPNSTLEEFYLLQKMVRGLGSPHIDHRLREVDIQDQSNMGVFPGLDMPITELQTCDAILLIGSNLQKEQPLGALQVRQASLKGASILAINSVDYSFNFKINTKKIVAPHFIPAALASLINAIKPEFEGIEPDETVKVLAQTLQGKQKICILLGAQSLHHSQASIIRFLAKKLAALTGGKLGYMTAGANGAGGWLAGAIPHRQVAGGTLNHIGLDAYAMLQKPRKAYLLLNVEPEDCAHSALAIEALKQAKCVIAFSIYRHAVLEDYADLILPITPFTETAGTFVNISGEWQSFNGVAKPYASSRPAWKVLRVMGNFLNLDGFNYESSEEITQEVRKLVGQRQEVSIDESFSQDLSILSQKKHMTRIGEIPIYATDSLVRHSDPLQKTQRVIEGELGVVRLHPETAYQIGVQEGDSVRVKQSHSATVELPVLFDTHVAVDAAWIAGGLPIMNELGELFGEIQIEKCIAG